jgi:hypothetical protein
MPIEVSLLSDSIPNLWEWNFLTAHFYLYFTRYPDLVHFTHNEIEIRRLLRCSFLQIFIILTLFSSAHPMNYFLRFKIEYLTSSDIWYTVSSQ